MARPGPTPAAVVGWLDVDRSRTVPMAVAEFWPAITDAVAVEKLAAKVYVWRSRERKKRADAAHPKAADAPTPPPAERPKPRADADDRPAPDIERLKLDRLADAERDLVEVDQDLAEARGMRRFADVARLMNVRRTVRDVVDEARAAKAREVRIERTPAAVAEAVEKRRKLLEELAGRAAMAQEPRKREL